MSVVCHVLAHAMFGNNFLLNPDQKLNDSLNNCHFNFSSEPKVTEKSQFIKNFFGFSLNSIYFHSFTKLEIKNTKCNGNYILSEGGHIIWPPLQISK